MDFFIERLFENTKKYPDKIALSDGEGEDYTYSRVWDLSGRVYAYMTQKGIGTEDFVMVNLKRGPIVLIACIGIWRAGAAFVIVEEGYSTERTSFIYNDCNCKLKLDTELFEEIRSIAPLDGYHMPDMHDAAYACYTSGSTGTAKGVLHEYGVLSQVIYCHIIDGQYDTNENDNYAILSPLNFVAVLIVFPSLLYVGGKVSIVPTRIVKNPTLLQEYYFREKITVSFITPSFMKVFSSFNPELRLIYSASEPIKNTYFDNILMYNVHAQSETGFLTTAFRIDRPYEVTPIGNTYIPDLNLGIYDENNKRVAEGEIGELCFNNIYFRGYINQKEMTEEAKRGGIYHSGDMGRQLSDGNIVLLGRTDDMIKINGNRVDPSEIEKVVKEVLGINWALTKCVEHEGNKYIVVYFREEPRILLSRAKEIISLKLPYYMNPSHYIFLDEVPINENGKVARGKLPEPDFNSVSAYAPPQDDVERKLVRIMEKVLGKKRIGIDEDFYELGGDSILSMEVIMAFGNEEFTVEDIFRERTIRKIAAYIRRMPESGKDLGENAKLRAIEKEGVRAVPYQQFWFDRQLFNPMERMATELNLPVLMRYENMDADRLSYAVKKVIFAHPLLLSKLYFDDENRLSQRYDETLFEEILPEKISEEEFEELIPSLVKPFVLINQRLYRTRIFDTGNYTYLFVDVHHIISDGTSMHILFRDIYKAYLGEKLKKDYIYLYYKRCEQRFEDEYYLECKDYLTDLYGNDKWDSCPVRDAEAETFAPGYFESVINQDREKILEVSESLKINENGLFMMITMLALAEYNKSDRVLITWAYHGRDTKHKNNMVGLLIKDIVIALKLYPGMTYKNAAEIIENQISSGIAHSLYPYSFMCDQGYQNDKICFLFQGSIYEFSGELGIKGTKIKIPRDKQTAENSMDVMVMDDGGEYVLGIDYLKECYNDESIGKFVKIYMRILNRLCSNPDEEIGI